MCQVSINILDNNEDRVEHCRKQFDQLETSQRKPRYANDDLVLLSSSYGTPRFSTNTCQECLRRECQRRNTSNQKQEYVTLRNFRDRSLSFSEKRICSSGVLYTKLLGLYTLCCDYRHWSKIDIMRTFGKALFITVIISCIVYIVTSNSYHRDDDILLGGPNNFVWKDSFFKPVSKEEFTRTMVNAKSHYDIIRLFLKDPSVNDRNIDDIVNTKTFSKHLRTQKKDYDEDDFIQDEDYDEDDPTTIMIKASDHYEEIRYGQLGECRHPRPEVERVSDHTDTHKIYFPAFTVLHRCRNITGCCWNDSQECGAHRIEVIERHFMVAHLNPDGRNVNLKLEDMVDTLFFENHTECACKTIEPLPTCNCPYPFYSAHPANEDCVCECYSESEECLNIQFGIDPLSHQEKRCVAEGRCKEPPCESGEYDVNKGACITVPNARRKIMQAQSHVRGSHVRGNRRHRHGRN